MGNLTLSYIIATRNRLDFLKITLSRLLFNLQPDEEIVIVDGASTDGTREYLQELFEKGAIHQYISESDQNQAHAWNKAMLMARGTLIKKIIDDDVFCYKAIRKCKDYMLENPAIDLCLSNTLGTSLARPGDISLSSDLHHYKNWKAGKITSFPFTDASILIRKASLGLLGLYDTQFKMMDWDYSLRATYLKLNIVYYTGYNVMSVYTPGNVSSTATVQELKHEGRIGYTKYNYSEGYEISFYSRLKIIIGKTIYPLSLRRKNIEAIALPAEQLELSIYEEFYAVLDTYFSDLHDFII